MIRILFSFALAILVSAAAFAVAVDEKPLEDLAMEAVARAIMKDIRCLQCQNQSIEDSNAGIAKDLRMVVRERVALGDSPDNVRAYLVDRYGDWVLLEPPVKSNTYFLWASPFLFLVFIVYMVLRSRKPAIGPVPLSKEEETKLKAILDEDGGDRR